MNDKVLKLKEIKVGSLCIKFRGQELREQFGNQRYKDTYFSAFPATILLVTVLYDEVGYYKLQVV
jgi:hypothetical protein